MARNPLLLLSLLLACLSFAVACNELDFAASGDSSAERPEGWESLEDEGSSSRLYYQFVDDRGRVRFVERIDEVPQPLRANVGFVKMAVAPPLSPGDAARARTSQVATTASVGPATASAVILYSAEWCGACKKAKRYLQRNDVAYEERNVDNPHIAKELVRKTGTRSIPVVDVDGRVYTGFSPSAYDDLIGT